VISTIGLAILLREGVKEFYSAEAQRFPSFFPSINIGGNGFNISADQIGVLVVATGTILLLSWFLASTKTGRQMQATAQNPTVARILGVNVERMVLYTFLINGGLAAVASLLISPIYLAKFSSGETLGLVAFVAAIVGGFNQVRGAIVGGFLVGVVDNLVAAYISSTYRQAVPLALLVLIILLRPQGLLGRAEERAV
jgi:branched-chain amino acid transport system permease protein